MAAHDDSGSLEIATLKKNFNSFLDERLYSSIKQFHWIATTFTLSFKSFSFLPHATPADRKFKRNLLKDLPEWLRTLAQTTCGTTHPSIPVAECTAFSEEATEEPLQKKRKTFFSSMRNYAQPVMRIRNETLTLQQEYNIYLNGEVASDYEEENRLNYWVTVQHRVPLLAKLARHVLCCPATSAQSERGFSHTGLISMARRSLLSPKYVSSLEFIAAAYRPGFSSF